MKLRKTICILLVCCLLSLPCVTCMAAEAQYAMTAAELMELEQIFNKLETANEKRLLELGELKKQLVVLRAELNGSKIHLQKSENLLNEANKSLQQSAKELRNEKRQKNIAYTVAIATLVYALIKK